jgi:AcrR family transcriptional regulator
VPRPDVSEERRTQILQAAMQVFAERGFHRARMDDIAHASGLSKGALYLYYKSKDAIIAALMRSLFTIELRGTRALLDAPDPVAERLIAITRMFTSELERMSVALPVLLEFYAVAARQRAVRQFLSEMFAEYQDILRAFVQQGIDRGELRPADPGDVAVTLIALYEGLAVIWVMAPHALHLGEQAEASVRLLLAGLTLP